MTVGRQDSGDSYPVTFWSRRSLLPVTAGMRLDPIAVSALLIDLVTYQVFYTLTDHITVSPRFATIQSFQRVGFSARSMLNMDVPQVYVTIGRTQRQAQFNSAKLRDAVGLIDRVLDGNSFAGLGHFDRERTTSFYSVRGYLFEEPRAMDYGRIFVGTLHETLIRRVPDGFDVLNALGVWAPVSLRDVKQEELYHCWLIGRQEVNSPFARNQAVIRITGDEHHWIELMFEAHDQGVSAFEMRGLHCGPGIFLGPRGGVAAQPSLIHVNRLPTVTDVRVYTWTTGV